MKKNNLLLITLLVTALGVFNSCDKDDEEINYDPELIGYWMDSYNEEEGYVQLDILFFDEDGRGSIESKVITDESNESETAHFTYSTKNNTLTLELLGETNKATYNINGDILTISDEDGSSEYTRA